MPSDYTDSVFLNCPLDEEYRELLWASTFALFDCGFVPRCALAESDSGEVRFEKILRIMAECRFGIHDVSRTELDSGGFPRFNMPFELGLFIGMKRFGNRIQQQKKVLVLDRESYRYQRYLSDLAGMDISSHNNDVRTMIGTVRDWLRSASQRTSIPGAANVVERFQEFRHGWLPPTLTELQIPLTELTWIEYRDLAYKWADRTPL